MSVGRDYDVVIVGGGLVGTSLASAFSGQSLRAALVEPRTMQAESTARIDNRAIVVNLGSRRILTGLGLWARIAAAASPIERIHVSQYGRFGAARIDCEGTPYDALGHVVPYTTLAHVLSEAACGLDNVDILSPARVTELRGSEEYAELVVDDGASSRPLRTRLVVAADGARSSLRRLAGIAATHHDYEQTAVTATIGLGAAHNRSAYERFTPSGPLAVLPLGERRGGLVWSLPAAQSEAALAMDDAAFLARVQSLFGFRLGRLHSPGPRRTHPLTLTYAATVVASRLVLAGNAAHDLHPVAAQGFNLGLRDVAALAEHIVGCVGGGRDPGAADTLREYARARRRDQRRTRHLTHGLVKFFSSGAASLAPLRTAALLLTDRVPLLKAQLMRSAMGMEGCASRLGRGLPL